MMKSSGALAAEKSENSDAIKRLYRGASDVVRKLDKVIKNASCVQDCYKTNIVILRTRLRDICERLMFLDPIGHGKKAEDLLWRKVHYEAISSAKNFRKSPSWSSSDQYLVSNHIKLGIGTYHHLIFRLQSEFQLNEGYTDFLPLSDSKGSCKERTVKCASSKSTMDYEVTDWALQSYQRCLICMGDLARYHQEFCESTISPSAARYYHQALLVCSQSSMPHNQLGTLVGSKNFNCDAAYFYMRCVMGNNGFEGARGNLRRIFEKNQVFLHECAFHPTDGLSEQQTRELQVKTFLVGFLQYCEVCLKYPAIDPDLPFGQLCQMLVENFQKCLGISSVEWHLHKTIDNDESNASKLALEAVKHYCSDETPCHLSDYLIFKIFLMSLMCLEKLDKEASACASAATALSLATFSHLLHYILLYFKKMLRGNLDFKINAFITTVPSQELMSGHPLSLKSSQEISHQANNVGIIKHDDVLNKSRLKKGNLRFRRKRHDGFSLEESDLSEGDASSSSETDQDELMGSGASENEESGRSSPCSDEDQGLGEEDDNPNDTSPHKSSFRQKSSSHNADNTESNMKDEGVNSDTESMKNSSLTGIKEKYLETGSSPNEDMPIIEKVVDSLHQKSDLVVEETDPSFFKELLLADRLLPVVKMCGDWLRCNSHIIVASAQGSQKLWSRYVELLNLLAVIKSRLNTDDVCDAIMSKSKAWNDAKFKQTWPLPEDIILSGLSMFVDVHSTLSFESQSSIWFTDIEEVLLRIACLQNLGLFLSNYSELGITYNAEKDAFVFNTTHQSNDVCNNNNNSVLRKKKGKSWTKHNSEGKVQERKKHLMRNMAQLWLEAEVKELESSLQSTGQPKFSPYLIPDSSVLIDNLHMIRQLMTSKVFIFILPIAVLQCLDRMKKESIKAREAIRWLEAEFQKHNRYLRAQKQHERLTLSLLKYPKRKEKEAWNVFLILECANYFARHGSPTNNLSANLVTVLTAENQGGSHSGASEKNNYNLFPLAGSAGLKVETIQELHTKWQSSSKQ